MTDEAEKIDAEGAAPGDPYRHAPSVERPWGFPAFAKSFPQHPELDALVAAFARGDYRTVREEAPRLASGDAAPDVKRAALMLRERIEPDPTSRILFLVAGALLVFLTVWWVTHDGAESHRPAKVPPVPTVEHVD